MAIFLMILGAIMGVIIGKMLNLNDQIAKERKRIDMIWKILQGMTDEISKIVGGEK